MHHPSHSSLHYVTRLHKKPSAPSFNWRFKNKTGNGVPCSGCQGLYRPSSETWRKLVFLGGVEADGSYSLAWLVDPV